MNQTGSCLSLERLLELSCGQAAEAPEEEHLAGCPECSAQLQELCDDEAHLDGMRRVSPIGDFGPYRILHVLGEGGMARVYACSEPGGGPVAVKVCREPHLQPYFEAEAKLLQRCLEGDVPGILPLLGGDLDALPSYLVLPICSGGTLAQKFKKEKRLPPRQVWQLAKRLGAALAGLQRIGVVHGDLKPENILLDGRDEAWIADLGTARQMKIQAEEEEARKTGTRADAITAAYMAPEQARGGSASSASDIFCLGLILYEAASGRHPCGEGTNWEIVSRMLADPIPDIARICPKLPQGLAEFIMSCLAKEPRKRPDAASLAKLSPKLLAPPGLWRRSRVFRISVYTLLTLQAAALLGICLAQVFRAPPETQARGESSVKAKAPAKTPKRIERETMLGPLNRKDLSLMAASLGLAEKDLQGIVIKKYSYQHYQAFRNQDRIRILMWGGKEWLSLADFRCRDTLYVELLKKAPYANFYVFRNNTYSMFRRDKKTIDLGNLSPCAGPPEDLELLFP